MTSPIQTRLNNLPLETISDESLLENYVKAWEYVCKENSEHAPYVSETHLTQWYEYRDKTTERLRQVVVDFYLTNALAQDNRTWLVTESKRIVSATVKTEQTLKAEHEERERLYAPQEVHTAPEDPYERQALLENVEARRGWLTRLGDAIFKGK